MPITITPQVVSGDSIIVLHIPIMVQIGYVLLLLTIIGTITYVVIELWKSEVKPVALVIFLFTISALLILIGSICGG